jgi:hypothetical protein
VSPHRAPYLSRQRSFWRIKVGQGGADLSKMGGADGTWTKLRIGQNSHCNRISALHMLQSADSVTAPAGSRATRRQGVGSNPEDLQIGETGTR